MAASILDPPAPDQIVSQLGTRYTTIQEGRAFILIPESKPESKNIEGEEKNATNKGPKTKADSVQQVFYNPIQQFNRDLTVLAIKAYGEEVVEKKKKILEAKFERLASKKRKRQEADVVDKSEKIAKVKDASSPQEAGQILSPDDECAVEGVSYAIEQAANKDNASTEADTTEQQGTEDINTENVPAEGHNGQMRERNNVPQFTILDALSASGLRALRYAHEISFVTKVTANDLDASAVETIKRNIQHNGLEHKIEATKSDARVHMYKTMIAHLALSDKARAAGKSERYDVVDLDPYGTAADFFDAAVQAVRDDGGLLCVTCTDAGVWASNGYPEKAWALYGGIPVKGNHSHEAGLRLILHGIATSAARYGLAIEPLLSLSIDFYARVFVKIRKSPAAVKFAAGKTMLVYNCDAGCGAWYTQPLLKNKSYPNKSGNGSFYKHQMIQGPTVDSKCEHCGVRMHVAGPMYAGRIHSPEFIKRILDKLPEADRGVYGTTERIKGMLTTALEEHLEDAQARTPKSKEDAVAEIEPYPFFFLPTQLARTVHCSTPGEDAIRGALIGQGYRVTRSHCKPGSIKTDAPFGILWEMMREWIRQKAPIKEQNIKPGTAGFRILGIKEEDKAAEPRENGSAIEGEKKDAEEAKRQWVFDGRLLGREKSKEKLVRYQMNPREDWGPMNRAGGKGQ